MARKNIPKALRRKIYKRDKYICQKCGTFHRNDGELDLHHKKPVSMGGTNDPNNLITWCRRCHRKFHLKYGNEDMAVIVDFRKE